MKLSILIFLALTPPASAFTLGLANGSNLQGWQTSELTFRLNSTNCGAATATVLAAVEDAVQIWNNVPNSKLELKYGGSTTTTVGQATAFTATDLPVIICDSNFNATTGQAGNNGVLGVGQFQAVNSAITHGYILLNSDTTASPTNNITTLNATQLSIVIAHEMGHVLGLGHSTEEAALMYYSVGAKVALRLAQDDMDGIAYLYPRNEPGDGILGCGTLAVMGSNNRGGGNPPTNPLHFGFWCILLPFLISRRYRFKIIKQIQ